MSLKHSYVLWLLLGILGCSGQSRATMGVAVLTPDVVVVGIDSQISGQNARLACKLVHRSGIVIIASGSYNFPSHEGYYDFWNQAQQVLAHAASIEDTAVALDNRIRPLLISGLTELYKSRQDYYLTRYGSTLVLEFVVAGIGKHGPLAYRYWYSAKTPADFSSDHHRVGIETGKLKIVTVPSVDVSKITKPDFWNITTKPGEDTISEIVGKIVAFIHAARATIPGISDPITTAVIKSKGFRFLNRGECNCN